MSPGAAQGHRQQQPRGRGTPSHHLHALHQGQAHGLVPAQRHHTRRGLRGGLQEGDDGLHPHAAGLRTKRQRVGQSPRSRPRPPAAPGRGVRGPCPPGQNPGPPSPRRPAMGASPGKDGRARGGGGGRGRCRLLGTPRTCLPVPAAPARTHQDPVEGRGRPAPLHVAQDGHACVVAQLLHHQLRGHRWAGRRPRGLGAGRGVPTPLRSMCDKSRCLNFSA